MCGARLDEQFRFIGGHGTRGMRRAPAARVHRVAPVGQPVLWIRTHDLAQLGGQFGRRVQQVMGDRHLPQGLGEGLRVRVAVSGIDGKGAVEHGLSGNLCRCGTYMGVRQAVLGTAWA